MSQKQALSDLANEVLSHTRLEEVIGSRIDIKKRNANYVACCPFHDEKTPSFHINTVNQFYHCFGCKKSGNAIHFLREYDKMSFIESLEYLARQAGIDLPTIKPKSSSVDQAAQQCLADVATTYQRALSQHVAAKQYLAERGINHEIQQNFAIGYAAEAWQTISQQHADTAEKRQHLLDQGMILSKNGRDYDRFRHRLMFPIRNPQGKVIAFGGRTLGNDPAKYLNSPKTSLFNKSHVLYGLFEMQQATRQIERIIVMEGYMDVVSAHQHGIHNVVATLGTASNQSHIKQCLRYCNHIVFCFDGDAAGKKAAWHALCEALPIMHDDLVMQFLMLENGDDPDSFLRTYGKAAFLKACDQATPLSDFLFNHFESSSDTLDARAKSARSISEHIQRMPTGLLKTLLTKRLAQQLEISAEDLLNSRTPHAPTVTSVAEPATRVESHAVSKPKASASQKLIEYSTQLCLQFTSGLIFPSEINTLRSLIAEFSCESPHLKLMLWLIKQIQQTETPQVGSIITQIEHEKAREWLAQQAAKTLQIDNATANDELKVTCQRIIRQLADSAAEKLITLSKSRALETHEQDKVKRLLQLIAQSGI